MAKRKTTASTESADDKHLEDLRNRSKQLDIQIEEARTRGQTLDADIDKYTRRLENHSKVYDQYRAIHSLADNSEVSNSFYRFMQWPFSN
jgi:molecular chaperone GrpE (heat shock protein)